MKKDDKVICIAPLHSLGTQEYTVEAVVTLPNKNVVIKLKGIVSPFFAVDFKVVNESPQLVSRSHAELIKAWADGHQIEFQEPLTGKWKLTDHPSFHANCAYRIYKYVDPKVQGEIAEIKAAIDEADREFEILIDNAKQVRAALSEKLCELEALL